MGSAVKYRRSGNPTGVSVHWESLIRHSLCTISQEKDETSKLKSYLNSKKYLFGYHSFAVVHSAADTRPYYSQHPPKPLNSCANSNNIITINAVSTKSLQRMMLRLPVSWPITAKEVSSPK